MRANTPADATLARWLRPVLFVLLAGSALAAIGIEPLLVRRVERGEWPAGVLFGPVVVYSAFWVLYALDRWLLVRRRPYPAGRAFFQVVFGLVFGLLLLPSTLHEWNRARPSLASLARHPEARVRAAYVEALGFRGPSPQRVITVRTLLGPEQDDLVREAARRVLAAWSGRPESDPAALKAWADGFLRSPPGAGEDP